MKFLRNLVYLSLFTVFFAAVPSSRVVAQSVNCKGFTFTEGVVIGYNNGNVITKILNNRVYVQRNGVIEDNLGIYYAMSPQNYSNLNQDQWWGCVNPRDPSVNGKNMLGAQVGDAIPCNGQLITKNRWLNFYRGDDNFRTFNVAKIDKGVLRIHALRKDPNSSPSQAELNLTYADGARFNLGLLEAGWYDPGHSNDNPSEPTLTKDEIDGCFYKDDVKFADCISNPVIGTISSVTETGLSFTFSGFTGGIFSKLAWRIKPTVANVANERSGQITSPNQGGVNFTFASLPTGSYTLEVEGGDCNSMVSTKSFTIGNTNRCTENPVIGTISSITQTGLTFSFTGNGLPNLTWRIKNSAGNTTLQSGKTGSVNNAGVTLSFGSLAYGSYLLEIEGGDCSSDVNSKAFSITKPNCTAAPVISTFSNVSGTGLRINFTGATSANSINWKITNSSNSVVANGTKTPTGGASFMDITFNTLADATYTVEIEANDCSASVSSKTFTLSKPDCAPAPVITGITGISGTGLILAFSGGLPASLAWEIKNSDNTVVRSGITSSLAVGTVSLGFNYLAVGNYSLEIQGSSCASRVSSSPFSIPRLPCSSGPNIFEKTIYGISTTGLTFRFAGAGIRSIAWRILNTDGSPQRVSRADIEPQSDRPQISFDALPTDKWYKLEIQGGSECSSTPSVELFALGSPGALPIYISNFDGVAKKEGVALSWNVVSEKNGEGFQVLRYDDNVKTPQIIASIPLREEKIGAYSYLDENPANGANYYQLKQIDNDGSFTTSRIINVSFDGVYGMFMAPNPAKEFVDVEFESRINGTASFETFSTSGIKVLNSRQKVKIGKNKVRMNVSGLSEGNYILKMENGDVSKSLRFLKIH